MNRPLPLIILSFIGCMACHDVQDKKATPQTKTTSTPSKKETGVVIKEKDLLHSEGQYCYIKKVHKEEGVNYIDADYIQFFTGDAAVREAKKRGDAEMHVNEKGDTVYSVLDGIYIVNENKKTRRLPLADNAKILLVTTADGHPAWLKSGIDGLSKRTTDRIFILTIENGVVTRIKQQYLP